MNFRKIGYSRSSKLLIKAAADLLVDRSKLVIFNIELYLTKSFQDSASLEKKIVFHALELVIELETNEIVSAINVLVK